MLSTDAINFLDARRCIFAVLTPEKITRLHTRQTAQPGLRGRGGVGLNGGMQP
jgi:hypothetical protein